MHELEKIRSLFIKNDQTEGRSLNRDRRSDRLSPPGPMRYCSSVPREVWLMPSRQWNHTSTTTITTPGHRQEGVGHKAQLIPLPLVAQKRGTLNRSTNGCSCPFLLN